MRAILLAGGKGRRLLPYTMSLPKPLVPVGDRPIAETIVSQLARAGFDRVTISTGHLAGLIEAYFGDGSAWGVRIDYLREESPLGTAGALRLMDDPDDVMLVMNGDVLIDLDFATMLEEHTARGVWATVSVTERSSLVDFGVVVADAEELLVDWVEKPETTYTVSTGVYAVDRRCIDLIESGEALGMPDLLMRVLGAGGRVWCRPHAGYWLDIGRVEDYERAQEDFEAHRDVFDAADG